MDYPHDFLNQRVDVFNEYIEGYSKWVFAGTANSMLMLSAVEDYIRKVEDGAEYYVSINGFDTTKVKPVQGYVGPIPVFGNPFDYSLFLPDDLSLNPIVFLRDAIVENPGGNQ